MSKNDVTGDRLVSKPNTKSFEENFEIIFGKKDKSLPKPPAGYTAEELERDSPYSQWMEDHES